MVPRESHGLLRLPRTISEETVPALGTRGPYLSRLTVGFGEFESYMFFFFFFFF